MTDKSQEKAFAYALKLLAKKDYSVYELTGKLKSYCKNSEEIRNIITRLQELNYQSDARCAEMLVRHYTGSGYGRLKIFFEAKNRGVKQDLISACLEEIGTDWESLARDVLVRKYENPGALDYKEKQKAVAFLVRRGFTPSEALKGLKEAAAYAAEED